jgi:oxysterol-binding protein-related protein 3/6/7
MIDSNPMLAETFEDPRMKFVAEKVSHNPVILAYHAEGEGWELYATSAGKTKFWGECVESFAPYYPKLDEIPV